MDKYFSISFTLILFGFKMVVSDDVAEIILGLIWFYAIWHLPKKFWLRAYRSCLRLNRQFLGV